MMHTPTSPAELTTVFRELKHQSVTEHEAKVLVTTYLVRCLYANGFGEAVEIACDLLGIKLT